MLLVSAGSIAFGASVRQGGHARGALGALGALGTVACAAMLLAGCVRREIEITSTPTGAMVTLNGREVGRTPATIDFTFDGTYDVRLRLEGFDPVVGSGTTHAPVWDFIGADLIAEVYPGQLHRVDRWHFEMIPQEQAEVGLQERAAEARAAAAIMPVVAPDAEAPKPIATPEQRRAASR